MTESKAWVTLGKSFNLCRLKKQKFETATRKENFYTETVGRNGDKIIDSLQPDTRYHFVYPSAFERRDIHGRLKSNKHRYASRGSSA